MKWIVCVTVYMFELIDLLNEVFCITFYVSSDLFILGDGMEFGDDEDFEEKTKYMCENTTLTLTCPSNYVIRIKRANYGRFSLTRCNPTGKITGMNVQCQSVKSRDIVATK